jgi:hypothetical protein
MTDLPAGVTEADVERAVDTAVSRMFAPHELPVDDEMRGIMRDTQIACLTAALAGRVVVPLPDFYSVIEVADRNEYHPAISRLKAIAAAVAGGR